MDEHGKEKDLSGKNVGATRATIMETKKEFQEIAIEENHLFQEKELIKRSLEGIDILRKKGIFSMEKEKKGLLEELAKVESEIRRVKEEETMLLRFQAAIEDLLKMTEIMTEAEESINEDPFYGFSIVVITCAGQRETEN